MKHESKIDEEKLINIEYSSFNAKKMIADISREKAWNLISLFQLDINLRRQFNIKAILVKEQ